MTRIKHGEHGEHSEHSENLEKIYKRYGAILRKGIKNALLVLRGVRRVRRG